MVKQESLPSADSKKPGFFYGYAIVAVSFLILAISGGTLYTFGVFFKPLVSEYGWTRAATSGAFSLQMVVHGLLYIVTGRLNDRFGPRVVVSCFGVFLGLGYLMMSQTSTIWHLYLSYGLLIAIGMSGAYVPLMSTVARWFVRRRGLMTGIAVSGVGVGTMIIPPAASWLIFNHGWRTSYMVTGAVALVAILVAAQFLRRAPGQTQPVPHSDIGIKKESSNPEEAPFSLQRALHTGQFWQFGAAYFGVGIFVQAIIVHIVPHAIELGISEQTAPAILTGIGGLSILGKVTVGSSSDKIGTRSALVVCLALIAVALAWLLAADEMWMFYLFAAVFGFAYGGLIAGQSLLVADLFGLSSHGAILGAITTATTLGGAVGPVLAGGVFDLIGSYNPAFTICIAVSITGAILLLLLRPVVEEKA